MMCERSNAVLVRFFLLTLVVAGCRKGTGMDTGESEPLTVIEHCGTITDSETWTADVPHRLTCEVVVEGSLTLSPGVEVHAERGTALRVHGGSLDARGTSDEPLLFASAEGFPVAGDWVGLEALDAEIQLAWATVRHAGSEGALVQLDGGLASVSNLILSNSDQRGLYAEGTEFLLLEEIEVAYVEEPLTVPWAAAAVMSGVYLDQVDGAAVRLLGETLDVPVGLEDIGVPYLSGPVVVLEGGTLWIEEGAILAVTGDINVISGGAMVMRGSSSCTAALIGWEGAAFSVNIERDVIMADFRWASIAGGGVWSAAEDLSFRYSEISAAPGTALDIEGTVDETVTSQLSGNSFAGEGPGLLVPLTLLESIGENDYSGSSWDGVVVRGGTFDAEIAIDDWPPAAILVQDDLVFTGTGATFQGAATLHFADGAALVADGACFEARNMVFTHVDQVPGGWEGISVAASADPSEIAHSEVLYGGSWDGANLTLLGSAEVSASTFGHSGGWGILVGSSVSVELENNTFVGNAQGDVGP